MQPLTPLVCRFEGMIPYGVMRHGETPRKIVLGAMPSSGGTLVAQWLRAMGFSPRHVHGGVGNDQTEYRISLYRDPRDAVCSFARRKYHDEYELDPKRGLRLAFEEFHGNRWTQDAVGNLSKAHLVLRFEDYFFGRERELLNTVATALYLKLEPWFVEYLLWEFGLARNQARASLLRNFGEVNKQTKIHGRHISSGKVGVWRDLLTPTMKQAIENTWGREIERLGYD